MKKTNYIIIPMLLILAVSILLGCDFAAEGKNKAQATFKVYGNCGMCKKTIEGSLNGVKGIYKADWSTEKKMITVQYDSALIKMDDIHQKIAAVGYDTEKVKANDEAYKNLHICCQYERKK
ncbi:MAG: heavy-metal-associated domain-containing protein [Cytophagaceae bacterium]|nr:heavy-metal-associated domain-containing protein [Cytophagaceae bacterium]